MLTVGAPVETGHGNAGSLDTLQRIAVSARGNEEPVTRAIGGLSHLSRKALNGHLASAPQIVELHRGGPPGCHSDRGQTHPRSLAHTVQLDRQDRATAVAAIEV